MGPGAGRTVGHARRGAGGGPDPTLHHDATVTTPASTTNVPSRWILLAVVVASGIVFLDSTIVTVALPRIGQELPATTLGTLEAQAYITSGYLAVISAFLILGGAMADRYGRRRVFSIGLAGFGVTSLLCGIAPTMETLVIARLPPPRRSELLELPPGTPFVRVYRVDPHRSRWDTFRTHGPTPRARFDHQPRPPGSTSDRRILYLAGDAPTALVEAFAATRLIDRHAGRPWLARFATVRPVRLLDIGGTWPTRAGASQAGASQALATGDHPDRTQAWARAIHAQLDVDGIRYLSSLRGHPRERRPPEIPLRLWGADVALFERAADVLPTRPTLHMALDHPGLSTILGRVALRYGYDLA